MRALAALRSLGPIDAKSIARDSFLLWMALLPFVAAALLRWGVPTLSSWLWRELGFDLAPYRALLFSYLVILFVPMTVGMVLGFRLLDERDDDTLTALLVTPLSMQAYLLYRIGLPVIACTAMALLMLPLASEPEISWPTMLPIAGMAALEAPILALLLASVARNKVQGFALMKVISSLQLLPVAAWFVAPPLQYGAAILPNFWPAKAFWMAAADASSPLFVAVGSALHAGLLAVLVRRFDRSLRQ